MAGKRRYVVIRYTMKRPTELVPEWTAPAKVLGYVIARSPQKAHERATERFGYRAGKQWFDVIAWGKVPWQLKELALEAARK